MEVGRMESWFEVGRCGWRWVGWSVKVGVWVGGGLGQVGG
ncbi:hypothetical protein LINGRAHAP2_LOCUS20077 [Linum grandiflorum]